MPILNIEIDTSQLQFSEESSFGSHNFTLAYTSLLHEALPNESFRLSAS